MEISLGAVEPEKYIHEKARRLGCEVTSEYNQHWLKLPSEIGNGTYKGITFNDGFNLFQYKVKHSKDVKITFDKPKERRYMLIYNLDEAAELHIDETQQQIDLKKYQNIVVSIPAGASYTIKFSKDKPYFLNILDFSGLQENLGEQEIHPWKKIIQGLFAKFGESEFFVHTGNYNLTSLELFHQIENFKKDGMLEYLFTDAKAHEILVRQLAHYEEEIRNPLARINGSAEEAEIIAQATQIIRKDLEEIKTVTDLARRCATNNNKLQEGFQRYLGQTVNRYLTAARMEKGRDLLIETNYTVSEIVDRVGLRSKSYFSKMFREKYGFSPSEFKRRMKQTAEEQLSS
ncbi:AraC family transcriptional regulator [Gramella sp. BOM4]|nr:AraC family transcriptional regulator [Christiangramia bathymodioli]